MKMYKVTIECDDRKGGATVEVSGQGMDPTEAFARAVDAGADLWFEDPRARGLVDHFGLRPDPLPGVKSNPEGSYKREGE